MPPVHEASLDRHAVLVIGLWRGNLRYRVLANLGRRPDRELDSVDYLDCFRRHYTLSFIKSLGATSSDIISWSSNLNAYATEMDVTFALSPQTLQTNLRCLMS